MRIRTRIILAFMGAFLFALPVKAGDFTFFVGGDVPGALEYKGSEITPDISPVYGIRLGTNFVPYFGMEHTLAFSSDFLFPGGVQDVRNAKGVIYNSNLIFNIPVGKTVPYFTIGAGLIHQYGDGDMPVGTALAFNYGGGLKIPRLYGPFGMRFDMRGYRTGAVSTTLNMIEISAGVMISF